MHPRHGLNEFQQVPPKLDSVLVSRRMFRTLEKVGQRTSTDILQDHMVRLILYPRPIKSHDVLRNVVLVHQGLVCLHLFMMVFRIFLITCFEHVGMCGWSVVVILKHILSAHGTAFRLLDSSFRRHLLRLIANHIQDVCLPHKCLKRCLSSTVFV
jgi:hypothetical protein